MVPYGNTRDCTSAFIDDADDIDICASRELHVCFSQQAENRAYFEAMLAEVNAPSRIVFNSMIPDQPVEHLCQRIMRRTRRTARAMIP